jgi:hypothetical protein
MKESDKVLPGMTFVEQVASRARALFLAKAQVAQIFLDKPRPVGHRHNCTLAIIIIPSSFSVAISTEVGL